MSQQPGDPTPPPAPPTTTSPVPTFDVLRHEYGLLWGADVDIVKPEDYYRKANAAGQAALCFSGGGIRSAAFGLGLLQALSRAKLLTSFHYLSTVSGGGYIGSWLQRWIHEESVEKLEPQPRPARTRLAAADAVMTKLGAQEEPGEIKRLRENSNFITPKVGIGSNDTWTAIAISVRNILVNWLLFVPLLMLVALLPNLLLEGVASIRGAAQWHIGVLYGLLGLIAFCMALATYSTARLLPSYRDDRKRPPAPPGEGDAVLRGWIVYPLVAWSVLATLGLAVELLDPTPIKIVELNAVLLGGADIALASLFGMYAGLATAALSVGGEHARTFDRDWAIWPMAFVVTTIWVALGALLVAWYFPETGSGWGPVLLTVFGPLWLLGATLIGAIVFAVFRQSEGPTVRPDDDREWLARLSAVKLKPMIFWVILAPSVLLLNRLWGGDVDRSYLSIPSLAAILSGVIAVAGGRSQKTAANVMSLGSKVMKYVPMGAVIGLATLLFIIALLMLFGRLELMLATWLGKLIAVRTEAQYPWLDTEVAIHIGIVALLLALLHFLGRKIPVNRFSLNSLYRNRLARGFLGAARPDRKADRFTGFDPADNVRMHKLAPAEGERAVLYPVINVALNVTATENLAWQERKAEPFIFTPAYCGSGMLSREGQPLSRRTGAYVETQIYAGQEPDIGMNEPEVALGAKTPLGVTLATAMSLSGAAATPNMGYYSSPATAFLMTLFNVRLGAWLPNPALAETLKADISRSGPRDSVGSLLSELTGSTHDRGPAIYLSDGGHFENLALYEMVRRRCRYIVVSDAAADPKCALKDLGNAVRKVKIDLDVDIKFSKLHISGRDQPLDPKSQFAWALGKIRYPEGLDGDILYIKPSYFGEGLPADVIAYARGNLAFPHESTADQFFSESQFESYRHLADHYLGTLLDDMDKMRIAKRRRGPRTIKDLFDVAAQLDGGGFTPPAAKPRPRPRAGRRKP